MMTNVCEECGAYFESAGYRPYCCDEHRKIGHARLTLPYSRSPTFRRRPPAQPPLPRGVKRETYETLQADRASRPKRKLSVAEAWQTLSDADEVLPMNDAGKHVGFSRYKK